MNLQNISGIYCIENLLDHKKYIGASKKMGNRFARHRYKLSCGVHPNHHLQAAWNRDGETSFSFYPLVLCSADELPINEVLLIAEWKANDRTFGYNLDGGGQQNHKLSEETKQKIRNKLMGHTHTPEAREKIRQAHLGERNCNFGKPRPPEANAKSAEKHRGKPCTWHSKSVATRLENDNYIWKNDDKRRQAKPISANCASQPL